MSLRTNLTILVMAILIGGLAFITYQNRPVVELAQSQTTETTTSGNQSYTMADVEAHASYNDCWTTINGSVYDLTDWVSRHPGGSRAIESICGIDGTAEFERQHGGSSSVQKILALFFIGDLSK